MLLIHEMRITKSLCEMPKADIIPILQMGKLSLRLNGVPEVTRKGVMTGVCALTYNLKRFPLCHVIYCQKSMWP